MNDLKRAARKLRVAHHVTGAIIVGAWALTMGSLAVGEWRKREIAPERSVAELLAASDSTGASRVRTFGIYQEAEGGKRTKIGYSASRRMATAGGYLFVDQAGMQLSIQGIKQRMLSETSAVVGDDFSLKSFRARIRAGGQSIEVEGVVEGSELVIELRTAGRVIADRLPIDGPILLPTLVRASVAARSPKVGDSYIFPVYNPAARGTEDIEVVVKGRETIETAFGKVETWRLSEILRGMEASEVWIDDTGETVRERGTALGFVLEAEPREIAMRIPDENAVPDLVFAAMIPVAGNLHAQVGEGKTRVKLGGISPADFPLLKGGWQRIDGDVLKVDVQPRAVADYELPYVGGDLAGALAAEPLVQSSDARIAATARKIVPESASAAQAARLLHEWVFTNVHKANSAGIPSAVEVLELKSGDCNEHTVLYVALARSIGLPARIAVGVVWANARGGGPGLYYHAWPEVYLGRVGDHTFGGADTSPGWFPVDPTLGQFPADAGHMRFLVGGLERQVDLLKLIGRLEVETVE